MRHGRGRAIKSFSDAKTPVEIAKAKCDFTKDICIDEIQDLIDTNPTGQFTHNIISLNLQRLAERWGEAETNEVIKELKLDRKFGIQPTDGTGEEFRGFQVHTTVVEL